MGHSVWLVCVMLVASCSGAAINTATSEDVISKVGQAIDCEYNEILIS